MGAPIYKNPKYNPSNPADTPDKSRNRANEDITAPEVRLVNADGTHEVLPLAEALQAARDAELDLVEVSGSQPCTDWA